MKVKELAALLDKLDPETEIGISDCDEIIIISSITAHVFPIEGKVIYAIDAAYESDELM